MHLYRKETDQELIAAAEAAYAEAPPSRHGARTAFARNLGRNRTVDPMAPPSLADQVARADQRIA